MVSIPPKYLHSFGPLTISPDHGLHTLDWSKPVVNGFALTIGSLGLRRGLVDSAFLYGAYIQISTCGGEPDLYSIGM